MQRTLVLRKFKFTDIGIVFFGGGEFYLFIYFYVFVFWLVVETYLDSVFRVFPLRGGPCPIGLGFLLHGRMAVAVSATTRTAGYPIRIVRGNRGGPVVVACPSACRWRGAEHWGCTGSDYLQAGNLSYPSLVDRGWSIALYFLGFPVAGCVLRRTGAVHFSGFLCCILATSTSTSRGSVGCSAHLFGRPVRRSTVELCASSLLSCAGVRVRTLGLCARAC